MASTICDAGYKSLLDNVSGHTWMMALYTSSASLGESTAFYTSANEVPNGNGYTTGGVALTGATTGNGSGNAFITFDNPSFSTATFTFRYALIYDASDGNRAYGVLDFGADKTGQGGTLSIDFDTPLLVI